MIDAFSNSFPGPLPTEISQLGYLKVLNLSGSYFKGLIPPEYGSFKSFEFIHRTGNLLSGSIPPELGKLNAMTHMKIGQNAYRGRSNDLLELISQVKHGNASPSEQQLHFRQEQSHARPLWALQSPPYYPKPPARFQLISAPDDKCERESVPLKPGIHAVERLNQNTRPSSLVELCSRESPHACHSILFPPWCLVSGS